MNNVTQKVRLWCMNDEGLYTAIWDFVWEKKPVLQEPQHSAARSAKGALIDNTAECIRELLTAGVKYDLPGTIYMDLLNEAHFEEIAAEFVDDVLWDVVWN